jgi:hypothetical protein
VNKYFDALLVAENCFRTKSPIWKEVIEQIYVHLILGVKNFSEAARLTNFLVYG